MAIASTLAVDSLRSRDGSRLLLRARPSGRHGLARRSVRSRDGSPEGSGASNPAPPPDKGGRGRSCESSGCEESRSRAAKPSKSSEDERDGKGNKKDKKGMFGKSGGSRDDGIGIVGRAKADESRSRASRTSYGSEAGGGERRRSDHREEGPSSEASESGGRNGGSPSSETTECAPAARGPVVARDDALTVSSLANGTRIDILQNNFTNPPGMRLFMTEIAMKSTGACALVGEITCVFRARFGHGSAIILFARLE